MDEIKALGRSSEKATERLRLLAALCDDVTDFYKMIVEKKCDAGFLLLLDIAIAEDITLRQAIENYYVVQGEPMTLPKAKYKDGRIQYVTEDWRHEVTFSLQKRDKPIKISKERYDKIAVETISWLWDKIGNINDEEK